MFKALPFHNVLIEKPDIEHFNNADLLYVPFYNELDVTETLKTFRGYAKSYKIKIIEITDSNNNNNNKNNNNNNRNNRLKRSFSLTND